MPAPPPSSNTFQRRAWPIDYVAQRNGLIQAVTLRRCEARGQAAVRSRAPDGGDRGHAGRGAGKKHGAGTPDNADGPSNAAATPVPRRKSLQAQLGGPLLRAMT